MAWIGMSLPPAIDQHGQQHDQRDLAPLDRVADCRLVAAGSGGRGWTPGRAGSRRRDRRRRGWGRRDRRPGLAAGRHPVRPGGARAAGGRCAAIPGSARSVAPPAGCPPRRRSAGAGSPPAGRCALPRCGVAPFDVPRRLDGLRSCDPDRRSSEWPNIVTGGLLRPARWDRPAAVCRRLRAACAAAGSLAAAAAAAAAAAVAAAAAASAQRPGRRRRGRRRGCGRRSGGCGRSAAGRRRRGRGRCGRCGGRCRGGCCCRAAAAGSTGAAGGTGPGTTDGLPMTEPVPAPSTINIAESPAGTMPSAAASSGDLRVASSRATSRCSASIVSRRSVALLFAVEVRMPASSVTVFRYSTPAMPPAEQSDQHHHERCPVQRRRDRLAGSDQPGRGDLLVPPLAAFVGSARGGGGRAAGVAPAGSRPWAGSRVGPRRAPDARRRPPVASVSCSVVTMLPP